MHIGPPKIDGPPKRLYDVFSPTWHSKWEIVDNKSCELVMQDFKNLQTNWEIEQYEPGFIIDLYAWQGGRNWVAAEVKESTYSIHDMNVGPCHGAFIPDHKTYALGTAMLMGFDYAVFVYIICGERYYIPLKCLRTHCKENKHPKYLTADKQTLKKEGNFSLPTEILVQYHGIEPFMEYVKRNRF